MALKEILAEEIDDEKFDDLFELLFMRHDIEADTDFINEEYENALKYPLLGRLADRIDDLVLEMRDSGTDEETVHGMLLTRSVACIAIAAYADSEISDSKIT